MKKNQQLEWKETWRDDFLRWVCGFANAEGGELHIGRNDQGKVIGLADCAKLLVDTRARAGLIVVGDKQAARNSGVGHLASFVGYVERLSVPRTPETYPTVAKPNLVSGWEEYFYLALQEKGILSTPQYNMDKYILDFALFDNGSQTEHRDRRRALPPGLERRSSPTRPASQHASPGAGLGCDAVLGLRGEG